MSDAVANVASPAAEAAFDLVKSFFANRNSPAFCVFAVEHAAINPLGFFSVMRRRTKELNVHLHGLVQYVMKDVAPEALVPQEPDGVQQCIDIVTFINMTQKWRHSDLLSEKLRHEFVMEVVIPLMRDFPGKFDAALPILPRHSAAADVSDDDDDVVELRVPFADADLVDDGDDDDDLVEVAASDLSRKRRRVQDDDENNRDGDDDDNKRRRVDHADDDNKAHHPAAPRAAPSAADLARSALSAWRAEEYARSAFILTEVIEQLCGPDPRISIDERVELMRIMYEIQE